MSCCSTGEDEGAAIVSTDLRKPILIFFFNVIGIHIFKIFPAIETIHWFDR